MAGAAGSFRLRARARLWMDRARRDSRLEPRWRAHQPRPTVPRKALAAHGPCLSAEGMALEHVRVCRQGVAPRGHRVQLPSGGTQTPVPDASLPEHAVQRRGLEAGVRGLPEGELLASGAGI